MEKGLECVWRREDRERREKLRFGIHEAGDGGIHAGQALHGHLNEDAAAVIRVRPPFDELALAQPQLTRSG